MASRVQIVGGVVKYQDASGNSKISMTADTADNTTPYNLQLPANLDPSGTGTHFKFMSVDPSGVSAFGDVNIGSNTNSYSFTPTGNGGFGIQDGVAATYPSLPDNPADAFYKVDNWFMRNIIGAPPAPTLAATVATSGVIGVAWTAPTQYNVGFLAASYLPVITQLNISIAASGFTTQTFAITTGSLLPPNTGEVSAVVFTTNVVSNAVVTYSFGGVNYTAQRYSIPSLAGHTNFTINAWFSNNNVGSSNVLSTSNMNFTSSLPPSAPVSVTFAQGSPTDTVIAASWTAPLQNDTSLTAGDPGAPLIYGYQINYQTDASGTNPRRYGGIVAQTSSTTSSGTGLSANVTGLNPDTWYYVGVAARNVTNTSYGPDLSGYQLMALPPAPSRWATNSLVFPTGSNVYSQAGRTAASSTSRTVYNNTAWAAGHLVATNVTLVAVNTAQAPGTTASPAGTFTLSCSDASTDTAVVNCPGFGTTALTNQTVYDGNSAYAIVVANNVDFYHASGTAFQGFYRCVDLAAMITNTFAVARTGSYTFTLLAANTGEGSNVSSSATAFYVDDTTGSASSTVTIASVAATRNTSYSYVSGVLALYGSPTFTTNINLTNIGDFWVRTDKVATLAIAMSAGGTFGSQSATATSLNSTSNPNARDANTPANPAVNVSTGAIASTVDLSGQQLSFSLATGFTTASNTLVVTSTPFNMTQSAAFTTASQAHLSGGSLLFYVDAPSVALFANFSSSGTADGTSGGDRELAGADRSPAGPPAWGDFGSAYDHMANIATNGSYTSELQVAQGLFVTPVSNTNAYRAYNGNYTVSYASGGDSYAGYPDYSGIVSGSGYRYALFKWIIPAGANFSLLQLSFIGSTGFSQDVNTCVVSGMRLSVMMVEVDSGTAQTPPSISNNTTVWLDGNTLVGGTGVTTVNKNTEDLTNNPQGLPAVQKTGTGTTTTATSRFLNVPAGTTTTSTNLINVYARVGLQLSANMSFSYMTCTLV